MPPVVAFTIAYGAGLWTGLVLSVPLFPAVAGVAVVVAVMRWTGWRGTLVAALAIGAAVGALHARRRAGGCAAVWQPGPRAALVRIHDAPGARGTTDATVRWTAEGCGGSLRLVAAGVPLRAGARAVVVGTHRGGGVLRVTHARVLGGRASLRYVIRDAVRRRVARLYGARAAVVEALIVGRQDDIPKDLRNQFATSGLAHILSISGLHVGIIAGWIVLGFRAVGVRALAPALGAIVTWAYVALLGFPPPATRAAAFITIHALSRARQRHPPATATLAVAVLVVVTADPGAVTAVGAWLSAAAIAGIGWVAALVPERWRRLPPVQLVAVSIGATLFTAPITAFTFGSVALAGVITNLVAVPLSALAVPALVVSLFVGMPAAAGAGLALAGIEGAAELGSRVPGGAVTGTAGVGFALPWLGLLIGAVWLGRLGPAKTRVLLPRLAVAAAGCWAVSAIPAVTAVLHRRAGGLVLYVLDVGQGDAIAIRTPRDRWVLVDGGPRTAIRDAGRTVVAPFLRRMGVKRLEAVVLSHGDADHLGGVPAVLDAIGTDLVLEPGQPLTSNLYLEFQRAVETSGIHWMAARAGDTLVVDSVRLIVLHPTATWMASQFEPNENSVVLHLSYGCFDALLTGDAGVPVERLIGLRAGDVDLLKVGHHGSAGSTSEDWLDVVRPEYAVISVGTNTYGHPAPAVLERLARHEAAVWRTDREGTVTVRTDGRYLWVGEGAGSSWWEAMRCRIRPLSRSNGSSWSRSACTRRPPATSPICSTTSPSPPR